jgi:hypothetical protein
MVGFLDKRDGLGGGNLGKDGFILPDQVEDRFRGNNHSEKNYAYMSFPLGSGIFLPNSLAVFIHSEIIS